MIRALHPKTNSTYDKVITFNGLDGAVRWSAVRGSATSQPIWKYHELGYEFDPQSIRRSQLGKYVACT